VTDPVAQHEGYAPRTLGWGVLTVSSSRTLADDRGGARIAALLAAAGHDRVERRLVTDDQVAIGGAVVELLSAEGIDVIIVTGGTGVSPTDVTPEAVEPLLERRLDGFGELFRSLSFAEVGPAALLSRALAGTTRGRAVFVLPGSPAAVELATTRLVLPVAPHLVGQLRRDR
jgi:molybdenum cofactor biosynthesis protein B